MTEDKLNAMKAKIAAMMAKAKDRAATEAEAETALRLAMNLMKKYSLSMDDIAERKVNRDDFSYQTRDEDRTQIREIDRWCSKALGIFCDVKIYVDRQDGGMKFFGYNVDVELALYIRDLLIRTSEYEWKRFHAGLNGRTLYGKDGKKIATKTIRHSFFWGFTDRVAERLLALKGELVSETGTALVVLKGQLVAAAFNDEIGAKTKDKTFNATVYTDPYAAGETAGDKVKFHREMNPTGGQKRLK